MKACSLALAVVLWAAGAGAAELALPSVKVELPFGDAEFSGPGSALANGACLACHSAEMTLTQPKLSAAAWKAEVTKMRAVYKAPISDDDTAALVDYFVALQAGL